MKTPRSWLAIGLFALSTAAPQAMAASASTDNSDLWYIVAESGWGMQLVQRNSTIFATLFVYGPSGTPTWYVATMTLTGTPFVWSGDLYATTGPWFGTVPFNPNLVTGTKVGTMTWNGTFVNTGTVTYSVNGIVVVKNVVRQTLVFDNYSGHFGGGIHINSTGCANPAFNGTVENIGVVNITHGGGSSITIQTIPLAGPSCTYTGAFNQFGQMGAIAGSYACSDGTAGAFQAYEMQINVTGFTGRFAGTSSVPAGCSSSGWFGGLVVTTF